MIFGIWLFEWYFARYSFASSGVLLSSFVSNFALNGITCSFRPIAATFSRTLSILGMISPDHHHIGSLRRM